MRRVIVGLVAGAFALYAAPAALLYAAQDRMIFPAPSADRALLDGYAAAIGADVLTLTAEDGVHLYAWHLRATGDRAVLLFHGNAEVVAGRSELYASLRDAGFDVYVVAYRGYPGSEGHPSEAGVIRDARALWDRAIADGVPAERIVVHGRSLGGGVAMGLVSEVRPAGLVVESTFTSIAGIAQRSFPIYPVRLLLRSPFDSLARAPRVPCPVLVLHGDADEVIPVAHGRALAAAIPGAEYVEVRGSDHNLRPPLDSPTARAAYDAFLARVVGL